MFMFPLKNLARKELIESVPVEFQSKYIQQFSHKKINLKYFLQNVLYFVSTHMS